MNEETNTPPETLAAIIAEMRADEIETEDGVVRLDDYADRIEAAAKREVCTREQAAADYALKRGEDIHADRCRNCTARAPGNAAAMRGLLEAVLEKLLECAPTAELEWPELVERARATLEGKPEENYGNDASLREALEGIEDDCRVLDRKDMWEEEGECYYDALRDIREKVSAALAATARNCDRPECATAEGAIAALRANPCADHDFCKEQLDCAECATRWLIAPAKKGGAE